MPQYFDAEPDARSRPGEVELELRDLGRRLVLATDAGVFSGGRIDHGTTVLLQHAPAAPRGGVLLDLGCGYGPIALALAARDPSATVWAVDVNERAVSLCGANAAANGLTNVRACGPDAVPGDVLFTAIRSNPPIRIGRGALQALLRRWLGRLDDGGGAVLVVQKHLGADSLASWLTGEGWHVQRLRSKQGFRLLEVRGR